MPEAVAAAVALAGAEVGGTAGAFLIMNAGAVASVTLTAGALAVGSHQRRKAAARAKAAYNAQLEDRLVDTITTQGARSRCYGRVRNVDGVLFKATRGTNSEFYTWFVAVAGHEIDAFEGVYFGDKLVTLDGSGYVTDAPYAVSKTVSGQAQITTNGAGSGSATATIDGVPVFPIAGTLSAVAAGGSGDSSVPTPGTVGSTLNLVGGPASSTVIVSFQALQVKSKARVRFYTGAAGQNVGTVLSPLFPTMITATDHRFAGIAGMLIDWEYDPDAFPQGLPPVSAVFRGAKILDPRTGVTAWTENPALIARDWALYANGGGCAAADLAATSFTAAANVCDTAQSFTTGATTANLPLFTCGIVCNLEDDPWQSFGEIVESMAGKAGWAGGQLRVVAGAYRAPVATITEDWLHDKEPVQIVPEPPTDEAVNVYRPTIADKAQTYKAVAAPEVRATTYITADGRELQREITLGGVTDVTHAQHVCGVLLRDARNGLTVVLPCKLHAFQVELFDVVSVTLPRFGWSAKVFEVIGWQFSMTGGILLTLKETAAAIYQPDSLFLELDLTPNTRLPSPWNVPTIGALTVTSGTVALQDGSRVARVRLQWPAPADSAVSSSGYVDIQYWPATQSLPTTGDWISAPQVAGAATETIIDGLRSTYGYLFRARFVNALGVRGRWGSQTLHIVSSLPGLPWGSLSGVPANVTNATADIRLVTNGSGSTIAGNVITKSSGSSGYNAGAYAYTGYSGGCFAEFEIASVTNNTVIIALTSRSSPLPDWNLITVAMRCDGGQLYPYQAGPAALNGGASIGAYVAGDVLGLAYDGYRVYFRRNGINLFTFTPSESVAAETLRASFSLYHVGAVARGVRFGPMTRASGLVTEQIAAGAATALGVTNGTYNTGGNGTHDVTQIEASRTWTNTTSRTIEVHIVGTVSNVFSIAFNGIYTDITQAYTYLEYSVSGGGGSGSAKMVDAKSSVGYALGLSGSYQFDVPVPPGQTVTANVTSREANVNGTSWIQGDYSISLTAVKL